MPTKLRKLKITRVAVCPQGANYDLESGAGAHILLFKHAEAPAEPVVEKFDEPMGMHPEPNGDERPPLDYASRGQQYDLWECLWGKWECFCETFFDVIGDSDQDNVPNLPILVRSIGQFQEDVASLLTDLGLVEKVAPAVAALVDVAKAGAPMAGHRLSRLREAIGVLQQILDECTPVVVDRPGLSAAEVVPASGYGASHIPYLMKGARRMPLPVRKNAESDKEHCDNCDEKDCDNPAHDRMKNMNKQDEARLYDLETALATAKTDLAKAQADLATAQSELATVREESRLAKMSPEEQEATWMATLPEAVRKRYEADALEKVELRKKLQEADERAERADYIQKTVAFQGIGFVPDKHWPILKALDAIPDEEARSEVYRLLKAANEQLRTSALFTANGTSGQPTGGEGSGSASDQLMALAKAYQEDKGVDFLTASAAIAKARPDLYRRSTDERRHATRLSSQRSE
jgi:transcriptional regulator of met regulon